MNKKIQIGVVLLAVSMMSCGCGKSAQNAGDVPELIEAVGVDMDTAVVTKMDLSGVTSFSAQIVPKIEKMAFLSSGSIDQMKVSIGDKVKKGQLLATLAGGSGKVKSLKEEIASLKETNEGTNQQSEYDIEMLEETLSDLKKQSKAVKNSKQKKILKSQIVEKEEEIKIAKVKLEQQKELFAKIKVGDVMEGTVKNVTDFGAFIDLGGADGLLHISEMSWGRVESPKKVFNVGDTVKVFIKDINDTKIALSMKFPSENPWNGAAEKFAVGNIVKGKVARMTDFGAFVELAPGVDALLHVSQISKDHVEKPADVLKIGQEIEAKVVDFNEDDKKISLSIKALEAPEEDAVEAAEVHTEE